MMVWTKETAPNQVKEGNYPELPHVHYYIPRRERNMIVKLRKKLQTEDDNAIILIAGATGSGKSKKGKQLCYAIDENFSDRNMCYVNEQFYTALENARGKRGVAIMHDEAFRDFGGSNVLTKEGKDLLNTILEMRQQNTLLVLITPEVHKLFKTLTKLEVSGMYYIWKPEKNPNKQRIFRCWGQKGTKTLLQVAAKTGDIIKAVSNTPYVCRDYFTNVEPKVIDEDKYKATKLDDYFKRIAERKKRVIENRNGEKKK